MMDEEIIEIPDELFTALVEESDSFVQNEDDRENIKDAIKKDIKDFKKERKEAKVDTSVSSTEKKRYNEIGELLLSAGASIVQKLSKKEIFKASLRKVVNFVKSPVKLTKGAIDFIKKTPIFKVVTKITAVLLLGYLIFTGFFNDFDNNIKGFLKGSFSFVQDTIIPWVNEAFAFTVRGFAKIANFTVRVATGDVMTKIGKSIRNATTKMMYSLTNYFFGGSDSSKPDSPEAFGILALNSRINAAEEEATAALQSKAQKDASVVARQLKKGSSFSNLIVEFSSPEEYQKKVKVVGGYISANDSDIISLEDPEDMAQSALELSQVIKDGLRAKAKTEEEQAVIDGIEDENFLSSIKEALLLKKQGKKLTDEQMLLIETVSTHMRGTVIKDEEQLLAAITEASKAMESAQKISNGESAIAQAEREYEEDDAEFAHSILDSIDDANAYLEKSLKNEEDRYSSNKKIWDKFIENKDVQHFLKTKQDFIDSGNKSIYLSFLEKFKLKALSERVGVRKALNEEIEELEFRPIENDEITKVESNQTDSTRTSFNIVKSDSVETANARGLFFKKQDSIRKLVLDIADEYNSLNEYIINNIQFD